MKPTIGKRLLVLKEYTGLSLGQIARRGGYKGASSIQKLFKPSYNPIGLPVDVAEKLARAFVGLGDPPVKEVELTSLTGRGSEVEETIAELYHHIHAGSKFIPLFFTEKTEEKLISDDGNSFLLFRRMPNENGAHFPCPEHLRSRQLIAIYCSTGNMWPRFEENEIILYEHRHPARSGDDVLVTIESEIDLEGISLIGRLYNIQDEEVKIDVLSPRDRITIPRKHVRSIRRIMSVQDMLPDAERML